MLHSEQMDSATIKNSVCREAITVIPGCGTFSFLKEGGQAKVPEGEMFASF